MQRYLLRRILLLVPTLLGVSIIVFALVRFVPGDTVAIIAGERGFSSPEVEEAVRRDLGLDEPAWQQYFDWLGGVLRGDLGESLIFDGVTVNDELGDRLPVTIQMALMAMVIGLLVAIPVGIISAIRQDTILDYATRSVGIGFIAIPTFWLGTLVMVIPPALWGWAPPARYFDLWDRPLDNLELMIIPSALLGVALSGTVMRLVRAQMLEVMRQDYIRTAWSKGLRERTVITRHAIRNAFIPVITLIGLQVPVLIGGTVVLENIFSVPGVGRYLVFAIQQHDYPVVQGVNLLIALIVVVTNLVVDMTYGILDPRVRYS
ncbi:MAG TPA: ABC transporter permease [Dehalococcoidia bacterium]|nr:ABC transporter permease [Dehalococcoidia bacterium]